MHGFYTPFYIETDIYMLVGRGDRGSRANIIQTGIVYIDAAPSLPLPLSLLTYIYLFLYRKSNI